jgi:uncharacterized HAD superfamily protein
MHPPQYGLLRYPFHESFKISPEEAGNLWRNFFSSGEYLKYRISKKELGALKKLSKRYRLIIITARDYNLQKFLKKWIRLNAPGIFSKVIFTELDKRSLIKWSIIKDQNVILHVDDHIKHVKACVDNDIPVVIFDQPWNRMMKKYRRIRSLVDLLNLGYGKSLRIREYRKSDKKTAQELIMDVWGKQWLDGVMHAFEEEDAFVAVADGEIVGGMTLD